VDDRTVPSDHRLLAHQARQQRQSSRRGMKEAGSARSGTDAQHTAAARELVVGAQREVGECHKSVESGRLGQTMTAGSGGSSSHLLLRCTFMLIGKYSWCRHLPHPFNLKTTHGQ
jgi:hypothetical protein